MVHLWTIFRVIQTQSNNSLGGTDISHTEYDFPGKVLKTKTVHQTVSASVTVRKRFEYDHAGRLLKTYQQNNTDSEILLSSLAYNELGQLIEKNLHSSNGGSTFLQSVDMRYNIRGWLKSINNRHLDVADNNDDTNDLFGMEFNYDASDAGLNSVAQYNGNISDIRWKTRPTMIENAYGYQYDKLNQLISARYATWGSGSWSTDNKYSTNSIAYDLNGNILSMSQNWNGTLADNLTYVNYGNKLVGVDDAITDSPVTNDFEDHSASALPDPNNPASWEYLYDVNGNMIQDKNKGITVRYNYLNLPVSVVFAGGDSINWVYSSSGAKLRKTVYDNGTVQTTIDYVNGYQYKNGSLDFFAMEAGRVKKTVSGALRYEYNLTDHLGNTRVSFADTLGNGTAVILQEDHYYAFGLRIEGLSSTSKDNKFTYNGKELEDDHGLNWYHYGARFYDAQIGRWHTLDPLSEFQSPYEYVGNDPVNLFDPDGRGSDDPQGGGFWSSLFDAIGTFFTGNLPENEDQTAAKMANPNSAKLQGTVNNALISTAKAGEKVIVVEQTAKQVVNAAGDGALVAGALGVVAAPFTGGSSLTLTAYAGTAGIALDFTSAAMTQTEAIMFTSTSQSTANGEWGKAFGGAATGVGLGFAAGRVVTGTGFAVGTQYRATSTISPLGLTAGRFVSNNFGTAVNTVKDAIDVGVGFYFK